MGAPRDSREADANRHLVSQTSETNLRLFFRHATEFKQHRPRLHHSDPILGFAFTGTHANFQRLGGYRLVGKDPHMQFSFAANVLLSGNTTRLDGLRAHPAPLHRLQAVFTK